MSLQELARLVERSFVWHAVGDLVRDLDWSWPTLGIGLLVLVVVVSSLVIRRGRSRMHPAAFQRTYSTVHCECGRTWTVRS